ncbi:arginine/serine-rich protein PNISR [Sitodiplosis mosellana]|uniref:arginine/serine-rich protein PNISR n=1 Tax=Sitodiplosis mosellana TaxID=263140 RepID=UPI002443BBB5|nr:arginine/serine-rich protein PNISR [Sitodiplosis mosellana]
MYPHKGAFPPMGAPSNLAPTNVPIVGDNQWMSQSAYQNIDLDKVDWAALAQQWIHMKETCVVDADDPVPNAPPPPRFSNIITDYEEQGEAPMEVEHEDEQITQTNESIVNVIAPPPPTNIFQTNNWNNESNSRGQHSKHWNRKSGNRWNSTNSNNSKSQRAHQPNDGYVSGQVFNNAKQTGKVWSTGPSSAVVATNATPFVHTNNELKVHGLDANSKSGIQLEQVGLNATPPLDAAQRKTLPAWIRDGLEKMEREKLKQAERDREMKERDEKRRQEKLIEQNLLMQLNANESSPKLPAKSKFDSDSESDNDDTVNSDYSEKMPKAKVMVMAERTTVGTSASGSANATGYDSTTVPTFKPHRSKAEILTEIMLSVRKNLTEILLEVTNEEIYAIAQDTLSKVRTKGRKAQSVQKNALTANAPALGLVVYDDSDASRSGDDSDSDGERTNEHNTSDNDSDAEIKKAIQRRKMAFESKSEEIESYLADLEEREKQWLEKDDSVKVEESKGQLPTVPFATYTQKSNENTEIQRDAQKLPNVSKSERKGSRFSDAKGLVYNVANTQMASVTASSVRPSHSEFKPLSGDVKKHESDRRDSDDSDSSRKRSKHTSSKSSHHRSKRDRSRSPSSRKHKKSSHRRRSSSSSSDRSSYSRHSDRSRKHSRRERSSSDDRTSKSSQGSHKRDKYSREKSYSRSHSYKRSRH